MGPHAFRLSKESWAQPYVNGSIASVAAEIVTFPLDLAKTRLQIQGQAIDTRYTKLRYRGPIHTVVKIFKYEGALALYSGLGPAVMRQCFYGGLKRGLYETLQNSYTGASNVGVNSIFGFTAGAFSCVLCNPIDILKVRMQTQGVKLSTSVKELIYKDAFRGWFRGVTPNMWRTGFLVGSTYSIYDEMMRVVRSCNAKEGIFTYMISALCASVVGTLVANPFDVLKTRLMNQSRNGVRYRNAFHCFCETYKAEGIRAFGKGYFTLLCRSVPWHFVFFLTNEYLS